MHVLKLKSPNILTMSNNLIKTFSGMTNTLMPIHTRPCSIINLSKYTKMRVVIVFFRMITVQSKWSGWLFSHGGKVHM